MASSAAPRATPINAGHRYGPTGRAELTSLCTAREPVSVVLAADDALAAADAVDPAALSGLPLAIVPRAGNPWLHDHYVRGLTARGTRVTLARQGVVRLDRLVPLVLAGAAIGLTTPGPAADLPRGVVHRPLAGTPLLAEQHLVWRAGTTDTAVPALVEVTRELVALGALSGPPRP
jgi:hypothetical protein